MSPAITRGECYLCGGIVDRKLMTKHLKLCLKKVESNLSDTLSTDRVWMYHIFVEGVEDANYWMHLGVSTRAALYHLDDFLRHIWLECCGHLSAFEIKGEQYLSHCDNNSLFRHQQHDMSVALARILAPRLEFTYEYDFGSTTELQLRVISEYESKPVKDAVSILARNEPPHYLCNMCEKEATQICGSCQYWLCDECAKKHDCDAPNLLPAANSPRVGVCGYCGEEKIDYGEFDDTIEQGKEEAWEESTPEIIEPQSKPEKAVGRNDPCPCGSGKKYKKCCLRKDNDN